MIVISIIALLLGISNLIFSYKLNNKIKTNNKGIKKNHEKIESISEWMDYYKKTGEKKIDRIMDILNKKFRKKISN